MSDVRLSIIHDQRVQPKEDRYIQIHIDDLANIEDNTANEILVYDTLDFFEDRGKALSFILSKLSYNGYIKLNGTDFVSVGEKVHDLSPLDIKRLVYTGRKSIGGLEFDGELLESLGIQLVQSQLTRDLRYILIGKRPL